eukprot:COSAG02_NODE_4478_length_5321_cov_7.801226_2_plen_69_part_00
MPQRALGIGADGIDEEELQVTQHLLVSRLRLHCPSFCYLLRSLRRDMNRLRSKTIQLDCYFCGSDKVL